MKNFIRVGLSTAFIASGLTVTFVSKTETKVEAANPNKITICHRTAAVNNPYRRITVNKNSIANDITKENPSAGDRGHGMWSHNKWPSQLGTDVSTRPNPNVFNPTFKTSHYLSAPNKRWGDIIPPLLDNNTEYKIGGNTVAAMGLNYSGVGEAIYKGTIENTVDYAGLCGRQSAAQFCKSHIDEGGTLAECQAELAEMGALEDEELKKTCGTNFEKCSVERMAIINVRTVDAACSANIPTFNGSVATGTVAHNVSFEYGGSEFLTSGVTSIAATPASITGSGTFTATVSGGLADGTYYFRAVAIDPFNEGRLDGSIASFVVASTACSVSTGGDPAIVIPVEPPSVTTLPPTSIEPTTATLNGTASSNGATTKVTFEYLPLGNAANCAALDFSTATSVNVTSTLSADAVEATQTFNLTGLTGGTTYCYRIKGENTQGSSTGGLEQFTTTSVSNPTTTVAPIRGALKGVVWIDQNRNGKQDSNEPGLPSTPLIAELITSGVSRQSANKPGTVSSRVRKFAINATTDADGFYDVPSLEPGSWTVTATLQTGALEKTFDSTNGSTTKWLASAFVPINGVGEADFAAAGNAQVALDVQPTVECTKSNTVEVQWAGIDSKMRTTDDVVFLATIKNQESLVRGLPWGSYIITPICSNGTRLAPRPLVITKAQANVKTVVKMTVQLAKVDSPLITRILPATGQSSSSTSIGLSVLLILAGVALLMAHRRRRAF
jgi:LPXTG-motif cell wall-anchored protein